MQRIMNYRDANAVLGSSLSPLNRCLAKRIAMQNNADGSMLVAFVDNRLVSATVVALLKYNITFTDPDGIMSPSTQTYQVSRGSIPTPPSVPERIGYEGSWPQMTPAIEDKTYQLTWVYTGGDTPGGGGDDPGGGGDTPSGEQIQIEFTRESPDFVINDVIDIQYKHPNSHEYVTVPNESGTITQNGKTYQFSGWSGGLSSGQTLYMDNISTNQKYVANYIKVQGEDGESIYYHGFVIDNLYVVEDFDSATGTVHIDVDIPADQLVTGQSWSTSYDLPDGISWWPNFTITGQSVSPRAHATCYYDSTNGIRKYYSLDNLFFEPFANSLVNLTALDLNDFTADTCNLYYYDLDGNLYRTRPYNKYNRYTEPDFEHPNLEPGVNWIGWVGPYIEGGIVTEDGNFYCNVEYTNSCQISFVGRSADGVIGNGDLVQPGEIAHDEIIAIKYGSRTQGSTITVPTAPATITKNGNTYEFQGWRDGIHNGDVLSCIDIANGSTAETFLKTYVADYEKITDHNQDYYLIVQIDDEGDYYEDAPVYVDIKLNGTSVDTISNLRPGMVWYPKINSNEAPSGATTIEARFTCDKGVKTGAVMEYTGTISAQWLPYSSVSNQVWINLSDFEDKTTYTVQFRANDRMADFYGRSTAFIDLGTAQYHIGDTITIPNALAKSTNAPEYSFTGWNDPSISTTDGATMICTGEAAYTAQYTLLKYRIIFYDSDRTTVKKNYLVSPGETPTCDNPQPPVGKTFAGWDPAITAANQHKKYYATYSTNTYTISYVYNGATYATKQYTHGAAYSQSGSYYVSDPGTAPDQYYEWSGWSGPYAIGQAVTGPATYTGSYTDNGITVTFEAKSSDNVIDRVLSYQRIRKNTATSVSVPSTPNYTSLGGGVYEFSYWSPAISGSTVTVNSSTNKTYVAHYEAQQPDLHDYYIAVVADPTYSDSLNSPVSVSISSGDYSDGATLDNTIDNHTFWVYLAEDPPSNWATVTCTWKGTTKTFSVAWDSTLSLTSSDFGPNF